MRVTHYKDHRNRQTKHYHVSYSFSGLNDDYGFGYIELTLRGRFSIQEVVSYIKSLNMNFKEVSIISWQKKMR